MNLQIKLAEAKNDQINFESSLGELKRESKKKKKIKRAKKRAIQ